MLIIFRSSLEQDVLHILERERIAAFTILPGVLGVGDSGRALHAFPWPASNTLLLTALDEAGKARLLAALSSFRGDAERHQHGAPVALRVFTVPCQQAL